MSSVERFARDRHAPVLRHQHERDTRTDWCLMHRDGMAGRPCFSVPLLEGLRDLQRAIAQRIEAEPADGGIHHLVLGSEAGVFNLGGDLALFARLIRAGDRQGLLDYANLCVEVAFGFQRLAGDRVHSIAVVQGDALGGGFEAALCCHTIVAEEGTGLGFPEVLFDLFPGMGAYTFLIRRVSPAQAERMMLDGRIYPAEELARMGVVDHLVPRGEGQAFARELVRRRRRIGNALRSMNTVRQTCLPVSLAELQAVTAEWVDAALRLDARALGTMDRLVRAQERKAEAGGLRQVG